MHAGVEGRIAGSSPAATPAYLVFSDDFAPPVPSKTA
jgi:hypothetical protein